MQVPAFMFIGRRSKVIENEEDCFTKRKEFHASEMYSNLKKLIRTVSLVCFKKLALILVFLGRSNVLFEGNMRVKEFLVSFLFCLIFLFLVETLLQLRFE